jgi:hypothetical protein
MMKSKTLNIASALLTIIGAWAIFGGVWALFLSTGYLELWMKMYGATIPHTDFMIHMNQIYGLETLTGGLFLCVISLIPYRKGEKWAWYAILVIGGIHMLGMLILWVSHAPFSIIFVILWIVGLVLPYKQILGKTS